MRTTVSIDDDVLKLAKQRALEEGRPLGELVTEALRARIMRGISESRATYSAITFGEGGTQPGVDITDNAGVRASMDAD